jgi:peptidylprolyl isomerase/FKBP-type peptidyl-prolyl cis-trans isomerase FkpA
MKTKQPLLIIVGGLLLLLFVYIFSANDEPAPEDQSSSGKSSGVVQSGSSSKPNGTSGKAFANRIAGAFLLLEDNGDFTLWVTDKTNEQNDKGHYRIVKLFTGVWDTEVIDEDLNDWLRERFENEEFKRDNLKFANLLVNCVVGDTVYKFDKFDVACKDNTDDALAECERVNQKVSSAVTWTRFPTKVGFVRESEPESLYFQMAFDFLGNKTDVLAENFDFRFRKIPRSELQERIDESQSSWNPSKPADKHSAPAGNGSTRKGNSSVEAPSSETEGANSQNVITVDEYVGGGVEAKASSTVEILYRAALSDGTEFDRAVNRDTPYRMAPSDDVVVGLKQGIVGMRVGGKRRISIPPSLGYGSKGMGKAVPPDATVVYSVELLKVIGT